MQAAEQQNVEVVLRYFDGWSGGSGSSSPASTIGCASARRSMCSSHDRAIVAAPVQALTLSIARVVPTSAYRITRSASTSGSGSRFPNST